MKIKELIIDTVKLKEQISFYHGVLNFELVHRSKTSASFQIGKSKLTFVENKNALPYHFAFNIPYDKVEEALNWLKRRVDIISFEEDEIIDFENWKAKAIYFYDKDHNIVEFIARKEIGNDMEEGFGIKSILSISEIGIGTDNIKELYEQINAIKPIDIFDGSVERFCAVGNNEGLFIVVDSQKKDWFPTGDQICPSGFIVKGDYNFEYREGKLKELI